MSRLTSEQLATIDRILNSGHALTFEEGYDLRAEIDALKAERDYWHGRFNDAGAGLAQDRNALLAENATLAAEVTEWKQSFELYDGAIRRGTALWREATGRNDVLPDVGMLVWWLLTKHVLQVQDISKLRRKLTCLISEVRICGNQDMSGDLAEALTSCEQVLNETKE